MPAFSVAFTAGTVIDAWTDPPTVTRPSRINPAHNRRHQRRRATVGVQVELKATVGGVLAPLDAALGDALFVAWLAEYPNPNAPPLVSPAGQSSIVRFTPTMAGHYTLILRRGGAGGFILHLDAVAP